MIMIFIAVDIIKPSGASLNVGTGLSDTLIRDVHNFHIFLEL